MSRSPSPRRLRRKPTSLADHARSSYLSRGTFFYSVTSYLQRIPAVMPVFLAPHKSRLVTIASALLLFSLAGCGSSHHDIVGKWRAAGDSSAMVWEFSKDGSVLIGSTRGKYSFGDRDRIKIQTPFGTSIYQIESSEERMILVDPSGSKLEFTKVK